jgi:flavodoxin
VKTLVAWYSNSGTTTVVAERIAALLGAELEAIEESKPRPRLVVDGKKTEAGGGTLVKAAFAAMLGMGSSIVETRKDPAEYDLVVVGTPVWAGSLTPAVRSYLKQHRKTLPLVAFFCTAGDPAKFRAFGQMRKTAGKEPVATLAVKSDDARTDTCAGAISTFVSQLGKSR